MIISVKGSAKSGNYAHAGIPGKVGGSQKKGSGIVSGGTAVVKHEVSPVTAVAKVDVLATITELREQHNSWKKNLSSDEVSAIAEYTARTYAAINNFLRHDKVTSMTSEYMERAIPLIEKAINKTQLPNDAVLYRGISAEAAKQFATGSVIQDKGFVSTSVKESAAREVMGVNPDLIVLRIRAPKGANAAYLDGISDWPKEQEVLIQRGSKFRVTGRTGDVIDMELVGD